MIVRRTFVKSADSIRQARRFAVLELGGAAIGAEQREAVALMVSELATNSVRHAATAFTIEIEIDATGIKMSVTDEGSGAPAVRFPTPSELHGRGLQIVQSLSDAFGIDRTASGHRVWFRVEREPRESAFDPRA